MPLPWGSPGGPTRIPHVVDRAITVQQLRDVRTLLQRLTKTRLLRNTSEFSKSLGTFGEAIDWFHINLYQITDEFIKKAIPHVDPGGKEDPDHGGKKWYSWVEFVGRKPQRAEIMMSHWWGGRFSDFTTAIDRLVEDRSFSIGTHIWICTFANCQFGEDFGAMLVESPFVKVMKGTELTVHIVDRAAGSLQRSWCGLEIQYTLQTEAELVLYTSAGRVGSSFVSGGPTVEAVKSWDIRRAEATDPQYRRQILNYIAEIDELTGLKKNSEGGVDVDDMKRPQLEHGAEEERDPVAPARINGEAEFAHEARLFQTHGKQFEDLNMAVRLSVMKSIDTVRRSKGCRLQSMAERGVSVSQIRTFAAKLRGTCPWSKEKTPWWDDSFSDGPLKYEDLVPSHAMVYAMHLTRSRSCSHMELVSEGPQIPQHFVEFAWGESWVDIMSSLDCYMEAMHLPDSALFFLDVLSADFHSTTRSERQDQVRSALQECQSFLRVLSHDASSMIRGWPLYNMEFAARHGKNLFIGTKTAVLACSSPFPTGSWVHGYFHPDIARSFDAVDCRKAECKDPEDTKMIARFFRADSGCEGVDDNFDRFTARKRLWCAGPMLLHAAAVDDVDTVASLVSGRSLRLNALSLKGGLGESALHVAAGCSSLNALSALLEAKMDPDIEDNIGERPLHCAALGGHAEAVRLLLAARADIRSESACTEVPIHVAHQNPGCFLGVDTSEVKAVLAEAWKKDGHTTARSCSSTAVAGERRPSKSEKLRGEVESARSSAPSERI